MGDKLYTTEVHVKGGRDGNASSKDGNLNVSLTLPKELGGAGKAGSTNPESLFAAGYGACYEGALRFVARQKSLKVDDMSIDVKVDLFKDEIGFKIGVDMTVDLPGLSRDQGMNLINEAHTVCPYSKAVKNNISLKTNLK